VTTGLAFQSEEELVKQLQGLLRAAPEGRTGNGQTVDSVRAIAQELAERVHGDPHRWGLAAVPEPVRDDAALDAFAALLFAVPNLKVRQSIPEWFAAEVSSRARELDSLEKEAAAERKRLAAEGPPPATGEVLAQEPSLFADPRGVWPRFESDYPRDAFALRLRYLLRREPDEMADMLEAPSPRAIRMRLDRARERFRMFCEQQGMSKSDAMHLVEQLSEEPEQ
jgi:type VI protein secretion system component VasF